MKKYTSEEVISLHNEYMSTEYSRYYGEDAGELTISFNQWLKDKESSDLPVKDQLIWVRNISGKDHEWYQRHFAKLDESGKAICWFGVGAISKDRDNNLELTRVWDEYSLTNPNE